MLKEMHRYKLKTQLLATQGSIEHVANQTLTQY